MRRSRVLVALSAAVLLSATIACSGNDPSAPENDPLAGLTVATRGGNAPEEAPEPDSLGPGHFEGTLYGYDPGPDTLANAVRIAGARVTAYVREEANGQVAAGDQVASVLTDAQGFFRLPTLRSDQYVVTFVPAASSPYRGGWTTAQAWTHSGDSPWFIMLPRK